MLVSRLLSRPLARALSTLIVALGLYMASGAALAQSFVSINSSTASVRAKPTAKSAKLWELNRGYPLMVTQRKGQWLKVRDFEGELGWIHRPLTGNTAHHVVTAKVANLRASPNPKARLVGKVERYEQLKTLRKSNGWVQVKRENGDQGWISQKLLWGW